MRLAVATLAFALAAFAPAVAHGGTMGVVLVIVGVMLIVQQIVQKRGED